MQFFIKCLVAFFLAIIFNASQAQIYNLDSAKDNLSAYIKMRASLNPKEEPVFYATGTVYAYDPEKPWKKLFNFEMFNIARVEKMGADSGYRLITREMLVYKDPNTNEILDKWLNPWTNETVDVYHVWNDPVNQTFTYKSGWKCPYARMGEGRINFYNDVPLSYPSPLKKADYPLNSRSDVYQGAEMFNFFCNEADIQNKKINNVNVDISWSRFSDFLPWMRMGSRPGNLFYQSRGWKVNGGFAGLPKNLKDYVYANKPEYAKAPENFVTPNMTSWKYFKLMAGANK
jgi:hypothetical protein